MADNVVLKPEAAEALREIEMYLCAISLISTSHSLEDMTTLGERGTACVWFLNNKASQTLERCLTELDISNG